MSRKTSSITFRLGISYFWNDRQYCIDNFFFFKVLNTFKLLKGFLFLNNLDLIYYSVNRFFLTSVIFTAVVYPFQTLDLTLAKENLTVLRLKFKILYLTNYFNLVFKKHFRLNYIYKSLLRLKGFLNTLLSMLSNFKILIYNYLFLFLYYYAYIKQIFSRVLIEFQHLESLFFHVFIKKKKWLALRKKEIPLKVIEIYLKEFLNRFYTTSIEVSILNIFRLLKSKRYKLNLNLVRLWRFKKYNYFWNFINIFYLGLLFNKIDLILEVIARGLERKKKLHKRYLFTILDILGVLYQQKILPLRGLRLVVSGKIDSKVRKKHMNYTQGTLCLQTLDSRLLYSLIHYDTRFGVISLRFWIAKV